MYIIHFTTNNMLRVTLILFTSMFYLELGSGWDDHRFLFIALLILALVCFVVLVIGLACIRYRTSRGSWSRADDEVGEETNTSNGSSTYPYIKHRVIPVDSKHLIYILNICYIANLLQNSYFQNIAVKVVISFGGVIATLYS